MYFSFLGPYREDPDPDIVDSAHNCKARGTQLPLRFAHIFLQLARPSRCHPFPCRTSCIIWKMHMHIIQNSSVQPRLVLNQTWSKVI